MAIIGSKSYQGNQVENRFATAIAARKQISDILRVPERFCSNLSKEDGEFYPRRHMLHIDDYGIKNAQVWISLDHRHQGGRVGKFIFDADRYKRNLENQRWSNRGEHFDCGRDLPGTAKIRRPQLWRGRRKREPASGAPRRSRRLAGCLIP